MITMIFRFSCLTIFFAYCCVVKVFGGELTFELPDNEKQCFHEEIDAQIKTTLEFQVITGGNYDVDMELTSPSGQILYKDVKKQYDSFTWTTDQKGTYKFCFSNEFSTFSHKVVYFDFQVGSEDKNFPGPNKGTIREPGAMTSMENSAWKVHEALKVIVDYQTHFKLRETQGRAFAEDLNERVMWWSVGQTLVILSVGVCQVFILRSFFSDKKNRVRT